MQKLFILLILFSSCSKNNIKKIEENYDGPLIEIKDLNTFFTDSAKVRFQLKSDLYQVFKEGEEIYPEGLFMDIYSLLTIVARLMMITRWRFFFQMIVLKNLL